jgi:hypothetical protein
VSEYQYYEFAAIDRPLTAREQSELRSLSTRADITATRFVNTYEWGDFKGDARKLMERYFDAHLYVANWGTRQLMLRLPASDLDLATAYCVGDSASAWTTGKHIVVCLTRQVEDAYDEWDLDGHGLLSSIVPTRADLAGGDLRLLYLGWLRCVQSEQLDEDEPEPPVPAGMQTLTASLVAAAEFLCVDTDLLAAAAAGSAPAMAGEPTAAQLHAWVLGLPTHEKDIILTTLITGGDGHLRRHLLRRYREEHPAATLATTARTAGELLASADEIRTERERRQAERREQDRIRQERSTATARQRHLDALAVDQLAAWQRVDDLIATKRPHDDDTAVQLLVDLRDIAERGGDTATFQQRLADYRAVHARKTSLLERLELVGLDA